MKENYAPWFKGKNWKGTGMVAMFDREIKLFNKNSKLTAWRYFYNDILSKAKRLQKSKNLLKQEEGKQLEEDLIWNIETDVDLVLFIWKHNNFDKNVLVGAFVHNEVATMGKSDSKVTEFWGNIANKMCNAVFEADAYLKANED